MLSSCRLLYVQYTIETVEEETGRWIIWEIRSSFHNRLCRACRHEHKFEAVEEILEEEITPLEIGTWRNPKGGYFICFESLSGCAKSIIAKSKELGVALTSAGAPFPYGTDPKDSVIRIAPTFPGIQEIKQAARAFVCCVKLASVEKLLG